MVLWPENESFSDDSWQKIIDNFIDILSRLIQGSEIASLEKASEEWNRWKEDYVDDIRKDMPFVDEQWKIGENFIDFASKGINALKKNPSIDLSLFSSPEKDILCRCLGRNIRKILSTSTIGILSIAIENNKGVCGKLTLEMISDGTGEIYPSPFKNAFVITDSSFDKAIQNAQKYFKNQNLWPEKDKDIRWYIERDDTKPIEEKGASLGGAFALGIWKLLHPEQEFDFDGIAATAQVDEYGKLKDVGDIYDKLKAFQGRLVIVAKDQKIPPDILFKIIPCKTIEDAATQICENSPWSQYLKKIHSQFEYIHVLEKRFLTKDIHQTLPLLREIRQERVIRDTNRQYAGCWMGRRKKISREYGYRGAFEKGFKNPVDYSRIAWRR